MQTYYVSPRGSEIVALLNQHKPAQGFTDEVPSTSWWSGLLFAVLPVLLILGVFLLSQVSIYNHAFSGP